MTAVLSDATRLKRIRLRLDRLPGGGWSFAADSQCAFVVRPDPMGGEPERILTFSAGALTDEQMLIADAADDMRFLLGLVDRARARIRELLPPEAKPKNHAAEAAMLCGRADFQRFLEVRFGAGGDAPASAVTISAADRAAGRLRSMLGIQSRRALNEDAAAAERWRRLKGEFYEWKRGRG